jgi:hypothetical protein
MINNVPNAKNTVNKFSLAISCAVALSLFGGRWISYIGISTYNIYFLDFLYFLGVLSITVQSFLIGKRIPFKHRLTLLIHFFFIVSQLFINQDSLLSFRIRDLIPFIYLLSTPIIVNSFGVTDWRIALILCRRATLLCAVWSDAVMLGFLTPIPLNSAISSVELFSPRWDATGMSLCIGIILWGKQSNFELKSHTLIRVFLFASVLIQYSRASLIALAIAVCFISLGNRNWKALVAKSRKDSADKFFSVVILVTIISIITLPLYVDKLPERSSFHRFGLSNSQSISGLFRANINAGTTQGRIKGQSALINWIDENRMSMFGSGAGSNMILDSGAYRYLSGEVDVRAPHSWNVSCYGRFGIFGLFLWHYIVLTFAGRPLSIFSAPFNIIVIIYTVSCFGVIMESPFGAMPFAFFLAYLHSFRANAIKAVERSFSIK